MKKKINFHQKKFFLWDFEILKILHKYSNLIIQKKTRKNFFLEMVWNFYINFFTPNRWEKKIFFYIEKNFLLTFRNFLIFYQLSLLLRDWKKINDQPEIFFFWKKKFFPVIHEAENKFQKISNQNSSYRNLEKILKKLQQQKINVKNLSWIKKIFLTHLP